jgi:transketolase
MRKKFSELLYKEMSKDKNIVFITADLGYGLWDRIKLDYPDRFWNVGSSEQLAIGMACGAAMEGKIPFVYSITPFLIYRPYELIRNYINHEKINVKLIGGGRDRDYGYLGYSHWAEDDKKSLEVFENINKFWPESEDELEILFLKILEDNPVYVNLKK